MSLVDKIRELHNLGFDGLIIPKMVEIALALLEMDDAADRELTAIGEKADADFVTILMANLRECGAKAHVNGMPKKGGHFHELSRYVLEEKKKANPDRISFTSFCLVLATVCILARDEYDKGVSEEVAMILRDGDTGQALHFLDRGVSIDAAHIIKDCDLERVQLFLDNCTDLIPASN